MTQLLPYAQLRMMFQISLPPPASPGLRSNPEPYSGTPLPTSSIPDQSRGWETRVWAPNTLTVHIIRGQQTHTRAQPAQPVPEAIIMRGKASQTQSILAVCDWLGS
ncbi:hypothetical protein KC365_g55 [Hortaea werneckii]|nr:hypothetical protein KC339_g53 [Hortaea werneckii]KAI7245853.1 hypothetical protein KC365_g55 [Hortaea werneckii]